MKKYILALAFLVGLTAHAAPTVIDGQFVRGQGNFAKNFVKNPFCEKNVANFASPLEMAATPAARDTDAADKLNGIASCAITTSANNVAHAFYFDINALDNDVIGNCEATALYKGNGATDGWSFGVDNGSGTTLTSVALTDETGWKKVSVNYPCTASARPVFLSTGESKTLNVGNAYWGSATNIGTVAQASLYGGVIWTATTNCNWSTTSTTWDASTTFTADADCTSPTGSNLINNGLAPDTKIPGIKFYSLPPGEYMITVSGVQYVSNSGTFAANFLRFSDGTNVSETAYLPATTNDGHPATIYRMNYSTAQSNITLWLQGLAAASNTINVNASLSSLKINVYRFPTTSEQAVRVDQTDTPWTSFTPTGSWVSNATYSGKWRRNGENMEVVFDVTATGAPTAAALTLNLPSGYTIDTTKLVSTTGLPLGPLYTEDAATVGYFGGWVQYNSTTSVQLNYAKNHSSPASAPMLNGSITNTAPFTYGNGDFVRGSFSVPIAGWTATQGAPLLVGSVTSNSSGMERVERALISFPAGTATIGSESGDWLSAPTENGSGDTTLNIASGIFSATPVCTATMYSTTAYDYQIMVVPTSATAVRVHTRSVSAGTYNDQPFTITCQGPR